MGSNIEGVEFPDGGELLLAEFMIGVYDWSVYQSHIKCPGGFPHI